MACCCALRVPAGRPRRGTVWRVERPSPADRESAGRSRTDRPACPDAGSLPERETPPCLLRPFCGPFAGPSAARRWASPHARVHGAPVTPPQRACRADRRSTSRSMQTARVCPDSRAPPTPPDAQLGRELALGDRVDHVDQMKNVGVAIPRNTKSSAGHSVSAAAGAASRRPRTARCGSSCRRSRTALTPAPARLQSKCRRIAQHEGIVSAS